MSFDRGQLAASLGRLAEQGVFLGSSSWKYPGWFGTVYDRDRYVWRGRFSNPRFERDCLAEYARTFPAVSVDATFYKFPERAMAEGLAAQVPEHFQFGFKVTSEITTKRFPNLPRFGQRAGQANADFLNAGLFADAFLAPCEGIRSKVGVLMFEFSHFGASEFRRGAEFVAVLDEFLGKLPRGWPYGVELRNRQWLHPDYFAVLTRHGVTHIYNAWENMPPLSEQLALVGSETNPARLTARLLLREERSYAQAVQRFSPYGAVQEPNAAGRAAAVALVRRGLTNKAKVMLFANNRFEGHSPGTLQAIVEQLEDAGG